MTVIQKIVRAGDLPPEWAKEFADPEAQVEVWIRERDADLTDNPLAIMRLLSRQPAARGLTSEIVEEILSGNGSPEAMEALSRCAEASGLTREMVESAMASVEAMRSLSRRAKQRGLTPEIAEEIMNEK